MRITILEFTPCVDWIYHLRRDAEEGYVSGDEQQVTIRSGAKLRPRTVSIYAGGKATNVARVIDTLLRADDDVEIDLIVFRPDSPEGRYIHDLQSSALRRVQVHPIIIEGSSRLCIDLVDPTTSPEHRVAFNISPRAVWQESALAALHQFADTLSTDLLLMAGNPPLIASENEGMNMPSRFYAQTIEQVRNRVPVISIDVEKTNLANCLTSQAAPDVIKINDSECAWIDAALWGQFTGTLLVTDATGCWVQAQQIERQRVNGKKVDHLFSTIGAGDAVHAGFTLARFVRGFDTLRAACYGQAVAAAAVSNIEGTRGINLEIVERYFSELEKEQSS